MEEEKIRTAIEAIESLIEHYQKLIEAADGFDYLEEMIDVYKEDIRAFKLTKNIFVKNLDEILFS